MFDCFRWVCASFVGFNDRIGDLNAFALDGGGMVFFGTDNRWLEDEHDKAYALLLVIHLTQKHTACKFGAVDVGTTVFIC